MGESLYRINKDALEIIRNLNGTKTFDDLVDMMISCHLEKKEQATTIEIEKYELKSTIIGLIEDQLLFFVPSC